MDKDEDKDKVKILFRMPEQLKNRLEGRAKEIGVSMNSLLLFIVDDYFIALSRKNVV